MRSRREGDPGVSAPQAARAARRAPLRGGADGERESNRKAPPFCGPPRRYESRGYPSPFGVPRRAKTIGKTHCARNAAGPPECRILQVVQRIIHFCRWIFGKMFAVLYGHLQKGWYNNSKHFIRRAAERNPDLWRKRILTGAILDLAM